MKMFKFVWVLLIMVMASFSALAEDSGVQGFIGAGSGHWSLYGESGSTNAVVAGIQIHKATSFELEHSITDGYTQDTLRVVGDLFDMGNGALTMQINYSYGQLDAMGVKANDSYFGAGLGYQYDIGRHLTLRAMYNVYWVGEFADAGVDLGRATDAQLSLAYRF